MKIRLFVILLVILLLGMGLRTDAGFHGSGLVCNKCHTVHYSEDGGILSDWDSGGPFPSLLIKAHSTELCLLCHDGQAGTPDVVGVTDINGLTERAAGFFAAVDGTGDPTDGNPVGMLSPNGHNLAEDKAENLCATCHWGFFGTPFPQKQVACLDCHDPHGKDVGTSDYSYRNLAVNSHNFGGQDPQGSGPPFPKIRAFVDATGINAYERSNIGYVAPDYGYTTFDPNQWREVTNVCLHCHPSFSGYGGALSGPETRIDPDGPTGTCVRHPNTESVRSAWESVTGPSGSTDPGHWAAGAPGNGFSIGRLPFIVSGDIGVLNFEDATTPSATTNEVFCLTCHKAHGAEHNSSIRWDYRLGNSNLGCEQCHNK